MTSDAIELDRQVRHEIRRGAMVVVGACIVLVGLFVTFAVVNGPSVAVLAGIAMFVVMAVVGADAIARFPRPHPVVVDGAVELPGSRLIGAVGTAFGLLLAVFAAAQLAGPDPFEQRRALLLPVGVLAGLVLAVISVALLRVPGTIRVGPDAVESVRLRWFGGRVSVGWDDVEAVGVPADAAGPALRSQPVVVQGSDREVKVACTSIRPTLWVLIEWLEHYRLHPEHRDELAGDAGLERLSAIEARPSTDRPWPGWFAPPAGRA